MTQAAIPYLEKRAFPSIVNVGSIAGANGGASGSAMYASSKAFIHNLTRHLAQDLAAKRILRKRHCAGSNRDSFSCGDAA